MADSGADLADFLMREDQKLAEIGELGAMGSSPSPDFSGANQGGAHTPDSRLSPVIMMTDSSEQSQPPFVASSETEPVVIAQRRPSIEMPPQRRLSTEFVIQSYTELTTNSEDMIGGAHSQEDTLFGGEPECIQSWRRRKEEMLDQKEAEASEEMRAWRETAQQELRDWYDHHNSQVETRKQDNRSAEEAFVNERDQSVPGTEWEKVANLCEFSGKTFGKTSKDVSRMRSIYLHLKENPPIRN